jgi:hypothetical protein
MSDNDVGEMFLNFVMQESLRKLCGVDVSLYTPGNEDGKYSIWLRWSRNAMGVQNSPYLSVQSMAWHHEFVIGDRHDDNNIFRWERVILNLPGQKNYDPTRPWVYKIRKDGTLSADLLSYVDDERTTGPTEAECWNASQWVSSKSAYSGIQDAARKRRPPSQEPGAWAGAVVHTSNGEVSQLVTHERWLAMQVIVQEMLDKLEQQDPTLFSDPTKTFLDNSCGDGQFLSEVIIRKIERSGCSLEQALQTTYGVDLMEDNIIECRERLAGPNSTPEILEIVTKNIVCHDALTYDYSFQK